MDLSLQCLQSFLAAHLRLAALICTSVCGCCKLLMGGNVSACQVVEQLTPLAAEVKQQEAAHAAAGGGGLLGRMLNR